jgi:carboxylesterase
MLTEKLNAFQGEEHQPFTLEAGDNAALLIHGFPGSPAEMRPLAQALHRAGWTARALLLPGFGPQVESLAERTHDDWLTAVRAALRDLQRHHQRVILIGHSMGGALAIEIAATTTQPPDALVLTSPFWKVDHIAWKALPILKVFFPQPRIFKYLNLDFNDPEVRNGIHNFMPDADLDDPEVQQAIRDFPMPIKMFAQIHKAGQNAHRLASHVRIPALVLQGTQDDLVKPALTQRMIAQFAAPVYYRAYPTDHNIINPASPYWDDIQQHIFTFLDLQKET